MTHTLHASEIGSTRRLLIRRAQIILLLSLLCGIVFLSLELGIRPLPSPFYAKLFGITCIVSGLVTLRQRWAVRHAWPLTIGTVIMAYLLTALSGTVSPSREYETTAVLFIGGALTTAVLLPWGLWPQAATVGVGLIALAVAVVRADGDLHVVATDPGAAVLIVFALSLLAAYEVQHYRLAHRRALHERRRAALALRRSNLQLEQRVRDRTAALEDANQRLASEVVERQKTAEALHRHQDELAHVLRVHTVGEMAAALAHEIHQPLGAITNYAQGAVRHLRAGTVASPTLLQVLEEIAREGLRAGGILRGIRNLVERESQPPSVIDVDALAAEAVSLLEPQARLRNVTLHVRTTDASPHVYGSAIQIEQVILNLVLNGIEAIADVVRERREVVVTTMTDGETVTITVSDSGPGIAPRIAEKLFTPFFTTKSRGLGLGLVISRTIIESHGGQLWATRDPEAGATFHISLPAASNDVVRDVGT